ncbi:hypothetical protein TNCV_5099391 [Trichonephila clavipes]|uniref:Uncharacterized protein n=1 Tax=Trichonephila clavipes TaxID=2585209 RepID=A0A8X6VBQ9_TRICX|nr:hypothetical protein TNCV_5099391 [Trichonephila clavipes]
MEYPLNDGYPNGFCYCLWPVLAYHRRNLFDVFSGICESAKRLWSSTLSLPSLKHRCHSKVCVRDNVSQPYAGFKIPTERRALHDKIKEHERLDEEERKLENEEKNNVTAKPVFQPSAASRRNEEREGINFFNNKY